MTILLEKVGKVFEADGSSLKALDGVDLHVPRGSIFGIIGQSGAGKSTLVRCINLLERPTSGRVTVGGVELTSLGEGDLREARKKIGMIFQSFNLLSNRTIFGNVALPLELDGWSKGDIEVRVEELLDLVGLVDKRDQYPSQLSGGQKQRVGIARALANRPNVLLSDEATSALDPMMTKSVLALLREINEKLGLTIVLITHEMNVVKEVCSHVAVIEGGRIVERGTVLDVFTSPKKGATKEMLREVVGVELPESFAGLDFLEDDAVGGEPVVQLQFFGSSAAEPVISGMLRRFDVDVNILVARIDHIQSVPYGTLVLHLSGEERERDAALGYLDAMDLKVEVIGHVGSAIASAV
ncbi:MULTISPECIES: methionine ABC transporter ATP-binding protein [Dethiosulfovibrio]|uniref:Methionine ABC transporter ATP-binding protein n=2 Tax=Dethiosulfovibrio TaxID=47054 RepID=A0ABS9ELV9_9BACT|nr:MULTISPECIES: methionine ABC transporter ATP-binding protein [Dethiosulfovibrio]MCF4112777.1 methionine ABC transporter ATP-binding protein [Dethiosulfovibrio russensis]MCF4141241.1 methionine ABC transporter ATP-binding protein [Dethiosulfovibrio marinus]MCF4144927.1 methionine ABC transporter ATP-binding protein [Dethiosulfovibrio acidaminovorans]